MSIRKVSIVEVIVDYQGIGLDNLNLHPDIDATEDFAQRANARLQGIEPRGLRYPPNFNPFPDFSNFKETPWRERKDLRRERKKTHD